MTSPPTFGISSEREYPPPSAQKTILVTGADGFIGKNLCLRLQEMGFEVLKFVRQSDVATLPSLVNRVGAVIHLAGENRPKDASAFDQVNRGLTESICDAVAKSSTRPTVILSSSTQAERDNPYGRSKLAAEKAVTRLSEAFQVPVVIFRLPGVFGKWCKPHYNSVVATFCHNIARGLPVQIHDPNALLRLVYVDDVVTSIIAHLEGHGDPDEGHPAPGQRDPSRQNSSGSIPEEHFLQVDHREGLNRSSVHSSVGAEYVGKSQHSDAVKPGSVGNVSSEGVANTSCSEHGVLKQQQVRGSGNAWLVQGFVSPEYSITLGDLADQVRAFDNCRSSLVSERVGTGLVRALYSTYISYLPKERFAYEVVQHSDPRGTFVEMLKTQDSGQFSFFTAHPGVTRGGHYHHSKTEKFLVIKGQALFRFRHLLTDERFELHTSGGKPTIVDTIPGWVHDITNTGDDEMVVMLWANENFDRERPDTISSHL